MRDKKSHNDKTVFFAESIITLHQYIGIENRTTTFGLEEEQYTTRVCTLNSQLCEAVRRLILVAFMLDIYEIFMRRASTCAYRGDSFPLSFDGNISSSYSNWEKWVISKWRNLSSPSTMSIEITRF